MEQGKTLLHNEGIVEIVATLFVMFVYSEMGDPTDGCWGRGLEGHRKGRKAIFNCRQQFLCILCIHELCPLSNVVGVETIMILSCCVEISFPKKV